MKPVSVRSSGASTTKGVGTKWGERLRGGVFGSVSTATSGRALRGWDRNSSFRRRRSSMRTNSLVGPDIFLFGFSRGAFTAEVSAASSTIWACRKITLSGTDPYKGPLCDHPAVMSAWNLYADRPTPEERTAVVEKKASDALLRKIAQHDADADKFRATMTVFPVRIHCLCVWDTVGALGVPKVFDYAWIPRFSSKYEFHDTRLGGCVTNAYHAVAIDEQREPYCVTLWTEPSQRPRTSSNAGSRGARRCRRWV